MALLELASVNTFYGRSHILFDVSLSVEKGGVVSLLGRNGAGKSTTFRSIIGLTPPRTGEVSFRGERISGLRPYQICRKGGGFVPEAPPAEPPEGLAPLIVALLADMIIRIRAEGVTVLLAEQNLHFCAKVADRGYVIDKGSVKYEGKMSDLLGNEEIKEKYLAV